MKQPPNKILKHNQYWPSEEEQRQDEYLERMEGRRIEAEEREHQDKLDREGAD